MDEIKNVENVKPKNYTIIGFKVSFDEAKRIKNLAAGSNQNVSSFLRNKLREAGVL